MNTDFPRILTLLRKEKGISQKNAATELSVSQALLSHYEKGIRECGLDFLVRCANYYDVSCDYLLGRSPDRHGATLTVDDIPEADAAGQENRMPVLTTLSKKLISNSLNIMFDLLGKTGSKTLVGEVSSFLMLAVYRMFRLIYSSNPKNQEAMFSRPLAISLRYADAAMQVCEANALAISSGSPMPGQQPVRGTENLALSTASLSSAYPLWSSSLLNLIQSSEKRLDTGSKYKH